MKIAIVLNTSWNIHNFRMGLIRALQAEGHEVHTIAPMDEYTRFLAEAGCIHHSLKMDDRGTNPIKDLTLLVHLFFVFQRVKPSIILNFTIKPNIYGSLAAALLRIPVINNVCGLGTVFLKRDIVSTIALALYRISFLFPKKIFFQNQEDCDLFVQKKLSSREKTDLLPGSGVNLSRFSPVKFKRNARFTFLMMARLIIDKGVMEYIEAIKLLKTKGVEARFQILGNTESDHKRGIKMELLNEWIDSGVIEYLGMTNDVRPYLENADCIVLPSYREGTSRALLEAASSAKPIIATDVPGCRQVLTDKFNGFLCKVKDAAHLAVKMEEMFFLDNDRLKQFGENGRKLVENEFDENLVVGKYLWAISNLLQASPVKQNLAR